VELIDEHDERVRSYQGTLISACRQQVRLFLRAHRAELYLDNRLVLAVSLPEGPAHGRLGLLVQRGRCRFANLRAAALQPMEATITYLDDSSEQTQSQKAANPIEFADCAD
jgi:hypothetical protein